MATCVKCCHEYDDSSRRRGGNYSVYKDMCKRCRQRTYQKDYEDRKRAEGSYSRMRRDEKLKREYGITQAQFETMLIQQHECCGICGDLLKEMPKIHVDHDHETNQVRGLLCFRCNVGLGSFQDSKAVLRNAIEYLDKHNVPHIT